ncbi:energy transducer TonB [Pontibacter vulgaris]|uniref:energy transducer TonB n=1 Tax=Pontibacter vulgaris TaxID=2905679 RepID=UPI001FA6DD73|nr:hypothetical protein [Pontibacter vulgaris]
MKTKKFILVTLILLTAVSKTFATAQVPDILIYNGDTLSIFANPLEQLPNIDTLRPKLFGSKEGCTTTACWRGYQAEWTIIENQLFLTGIYSCCHHKDKIQANLKQLFGNKLIDEKVQADWVTADLISPLGKELYYVHMGYESLYEKEVLFQIVKGNLIRKHVFDNSKSRQSIYSQDSEKLLKHIYSNINWEELPTQEKTVKVFIQFSANQYGTIDSVTILKGFNGVFDREAVRVVKTIPEWDVYYRLGKHERRAWYMPIVFSEENWSKYKK